MWTFDNRTERFIEWIGVKYDYIDSIDLTQLHPDWRVSNLGRPTAIKDDAVEDYALLAESGSPFPAAILILEKAGYAVLDGVQRISAADLLGCTSCAAYVLHPRTSPGKQHAIRLTANSRVNGQHTPPQEFVLESCVRILYFEDGFSVEEIARLLSKKPCVIEDEITFQKTKTLMRGTGYTGAYSKKKWLSKKIGKYAHDDDWLRAPGPIKEFLELIEECKFANGDADEVIETFWDVPRAKKKNRHGAFSASLQAVKNDTEVVHRLAQKTSKRDLLKIVPALRSARTVIRQTASSGDQLIDPDMVHLAAKLVQEIREGLKKITPADLHSGHGELF